MLESNTSIDRSIGLLFIGLAVTAFIILTVIGMGTVQRNAEDAAGAGRRTSYEITTDIGG